MKHLHLIRSYLKDRTIGYLEGFRTLERPWLNNKKNESCIPEGTYQVRRDRQGRFQYFRLESVTGRTAIEMHGGTIPTHSDGCILVGMKFDGQFNLSGSSEALLQLIDFVDDGDFILTIRSFNPCTDYESIP